MNLAHITILALGVLGLVAIYASMQILISNFRKNDSGENLARVPIFINLVGGAGSLLFMVLLICLALFW